MLDQQKITILYCRLSNEDAQEGESNSIANQREYLTRYARDHGYTNLKILVDDGYTGTNFNRPGVQEGFELVKQGYIRGMIRGCMGSVSRLCVVQMQDYLELGKEARMNFPGTLSSANWTWRAEKGFDSDALAARIYAATKLYGRVGK